MDSRRRDRLPAVIRPAEVADIPRLLELGAAFVVHYPAEIPTDPDGLREALSEMIEGGQCVLVDDVEGEIRGGVVGMISALWTNPKRSRAGIELAWWVAEEHRGGTVGIRLLHAFEAWAVERGAEVLVLSDLVDGAGDPLLGGLAQRLGYALVERAHYKAVV